MDPHPQLRKQPALVTLIAETVLEYHLRSRTNVVRVNTVLPKSSCTLITITFSESGSSRLVADIPGVAVKEKTCVEISYHSECPRLDEVRDWLELKGYRCKYDVKFKNEYWENSFANPPIHCFEFINR